MNQTNKFIAAAAAAIATNILAIPVVLLSVYSGTSISFATLLLGVLVIALSNIPVFQLFIAAKRNDDKSFTWGLLPIFLTLAAYSFVLQFNAFWIAGILLTIAILLSLGSIIKK